MSNKEFVTYRQALLLKELGFNEDTFGGYDFEDKQLYIGYENEYRRTWNLDFYIHAPLKQQVFRWFREKYDADVVTQPQVVGYYTKILIKNKSVFDIIAPYEEAENAAIDKLIEIAKQQDND
jgi:hypothetical protein